MATKISPREAAANAAVPWHVRDAILLFALGVGVLAVSLVAALGLYRLQGAPGVAPAQPPAALTAVATDLYYVVILAGTWLLVVRRYSAGWASLGLRLPARAGWLPVMATMAGLAAIFVAAMIGLIWALSALGLPAVLAPISPTPAPGDPLFIATVLGSVALTPVAEEVLFRGVLYQSLRKRGGAAFGITVSALLFAAMHLRPAAAPELFVLGVLLAVAFERTRSLYPSILLHAAYNAVVIALALRVI